MAEFSGLSLREKQAFFAQLSAYLPDHLPTTLQERQEFLSTCTDEQLLDRYYHKLTSIHNSQQQQKRQNSKQLQQEQEIVSLQDDAQECEEYMKFLESL